MKQIQPVQKVILLLFSAGMLIRWQTHLHELSACIRTYQENSKTWKTCSTIQLHYYSDPTAESNQILS